MPLFLYRSGDGNEGNFPRFVLTLDASQNAFAAVESLLANEWFAGSRARRHVLRNVESDGETEFGVHATVYEGPEGETAFEAAWRTAELQPLTEADADHYGEPQTLKEALDAAAWRQYAKRARKA